MYDIKLSPPYKNFQKIENLKKTFSETISNFCRFQKISMIFFYRSRSNFTAVRMRVPRRSRKLTGRSWATMQGGDNFMSYIYLFKNTKAYLLESSTLRDLFKSEEFSVWKWYLCSYERQTVAHVIQNFLLPWGLPRSSARILIAKVCLCVCIWTDFYRMAYAPASNADAIGVFSEVVQKRVHQKRPLSKNGDVLRDTFYSNFLMIFVIFELSA